LREFFFEFDRIMRQWISRKIEFPEIESWQQARQRCAAALQRMVEDCPDDGGLLAFSSGGFMAMALGGPSIYGGQPNGARQNLFITEKTFELRHQILAETLKKCLVPKELRNFWLAADQKIKENFVQETIDDCEQRFNTGTF